MEHQGNNSQGMGSPYSVNQPSTMATGQAQPPPDGSTQSTQPNDLPSSSLQIHPFAYQQVRPHHEQRMQAFWAHKLEEVQQTTDFSNHSLPLARVKKAMKYEEEVCRVSKEASVFVAKACEMFLQELALRSWNHTEDDGRRTLQRSDVAASVERTEIFDFLADVVPGVDLKATEAASASGGGGGGGLLPPPVMPPPSQGPPYYYMVGPPHMAAPGMHHTAVYGLQAGPPVMVPQVWPQPPPPPPPPPLYYYMAGPPQVGAPAMGPTAVYGQQAGPPIMAPLVWPQHPPPPPPVYYYMAGPPQAMGPTAVYGQQAGPPIMAPQIWPQHPPPPPPPADG